MTEFKLIEDMSRKKENRRRSRLEIFVDVLEIALHGAKKTHIMYRANLSYAQLRKYLSFLLERGMLKINERLGGKEYRTTEKGVQFIENYRDLNEQLTI